MIKNVFKIISKMFMIVGIAFAFLISIVPSDPIVEPQVVPNVVMQNMSVRANNPIPDLPEGFTCPSGWTQEQCDLLTQPLGVSASSKYWDYYGSSITSSDVKSLLFGSGTSNYANCNTSQDCSGFGGTSVSPIYTIDKQNQLSNFASLTSDTTIYVVFYQYVSGDSKPYKVWGAGSSHQANPNGWYKYSYPKTSVSGQGYSSISDGLKNMNYIGGVRFHYQAPTTYQQVTNSQATLGYDFVGTNFTSGDVLESLLSSASGKGMTHTYYATSSTTGEYEVPISSWTCDTVECHYGNTTLGLYPMYLQNGEAVYYPYFVEGDNPEEYYGFGLTDGSSNYYYFNYGDGVSSSGALTRVVDLNIDVQFNTATYNYTGSYTTTDMDYEITLLGNIRGYIEDSIEAQYPNQTFNWSGVANPSDITLSTGSSLPITKDNPSVSGTYYVTDSISWTRYSGSWSYEVDYVELPETTINIDPYVINSYYTSDIPLTTFSENSTKDYIRSVLHSEEGIDAPGTLTLITSGTFPLSVSNNSISGTYVLATETEIYKGTFSVSIVFNDTYSLVLSGDSYVVSPSILSVVDAKSDLIDQIKENIVFKEYVYTNNVGYTESTIDDLSDLTFTFNPEISLGARNYNVLIKLDDKQLYNSTISVDWTRSAGEGVGDNLLVFCLALLNAPMKIINESLNFEFLGIHWSSLITGALTLLLVVIVIKWIIKILKGGD